jgi:multiple sugar transport system ATP-binding protein
MANVTFKNIRKVYDKNVVAVEDFNLEVKDKEFVVLVGPSGCGKSTTLRMVAGLEEISDGDLYIDDKLVNFIPPKDRDIAMVFQNYALYPHMSVYENLAFSLQMRKMKKQEIDKRVRQAAETLSITHLLKRKPKALSGGERQRVAIGRAIVREPKVFLMDEPLSNLDAKLRNQMRAQLIKLRQQVDTTFIYVTHDQTEAMTLGDRIVIMKDGVIHQSGTPQDVFENPANLFVAGFIGSPQMNFLPASLEIEGGKYVVKVSCGTFVLKQDKQELLEKKKQAPCKVIMGFRPEHATIVPAGTEGSICAKIDLSEMMGSEVYLHVQVEDSIIILRVKTAELNCYAFEPGAENYIRFIVPNTFLHVFDAETEKNIFVP